MSTLLNFFYGLFGFVKHLIEEYFVHFLIECTSDIQFQSLHRNVSLLSPGIPDCIKQAYSDVQTLIQIKDHDTRFANDTLYDSGFGYFSTMTYTP